MSRRPAAPIGILDEHPEWSLRLLDELDRRGLPWERIDHSHHRFAPHDREPRFSVVVNRTSPSSHTRGHQAVLFYAEALLAYYESLGIPVVNPVAAYRYEKSKALQLSLFERVGALYPRAVVVNHRAEVRPAAESLRFPLLVKPNVGGSGAGIVRFDDRVALEAGLERIDLGPDGTALVQEYVEPVEGAILRVEVLDGECLYAIRIVRDGQAGFNLCPADLCQTAGPPASDPTACLASAPAGLSVSRVEPPPEVVRTVLRLTEAARIDVGGVECLVSRADGRVHYYDVNATSNFVANAMEVLGFDPTVRFADLIERRAREESHRAAA